MSATLLVPWGIRYVWLVLIYTTLVRLQFVATNLYMKYSKFLFVYVL